MSVILDQNKNYNADFGSIYRSSAIFYIPKNIKTTVSVSNYWDFKNKIEVGLLFSVRDLNGKIIERREKYFDKGFVINENNWPISEGSVEVEAFGNKNLRIPYAAVMGIYETPKSVSMVHSYGRNHNLIELEDKNSLTTGRESCWTIRKSENIKNYAIFHNGHLSVEKQTAKLIITNSKNDDKIIYFDIPQISEFQSVKFEIENLYPEYKTFLSDEDGWATLHFENKTAFTRLLLIWEDKETGEFQVTHSNFDYSEIQTNMIEGSKPALMKWPSVVSKNEGRIIIYPKFSKGNYKLSSENFISSAKNGMFLSAKNSSYLEFTSDKNVIPSRIVTGFSASSKDKLAFECSLGITHEQRPPKRFHWAVVSKKYKTRLYFNSFPELYEVPDSIFMIFRLYSSSKVGYSEVKKEFSNLSEVCDGIEVVELFKRDNSYFSSNFNYVSMFSNFGGWLMYSSMTKDTSLSIEHSF